LTNSLNSPIPSDLNVEPVRSIELAFKCQSYLAGTLCRGRVKIEPRVTYGASGISLGVACGTVGDCAHTHSRVRDAHWSAILDI
jgi:hypothetical protein